MNRITASILAAALLAPSAGAQRFRVVSSNIWISATKGYDYIASPPLKVGFWTTWNGIKSFYRRTLPRTCVGIVGMQEVGRGMSLNFGINLAADAAASLGSPWTSRHQGLIDYWGGEFGNAVLTNARISKFQDLRFVFDPNNPQRGDQQRGAIALQVMFGRRRLWFVTTHFSHKGNGIPERQLWELMGKIKTFDPDYPVIVTGDMNIENIPGQPANAAYKTLTRLFALAGFKNVSKDLPTTIASPAVLQNRQLDYMFVYDPHKLLVFRGCRSVPIWTRRHVYADHRALVADFEWARYVRRR